MLVGLLLGFVSHALDAHPSSYSGSAWKAFSRNKTVVLRSRPSYCYHAVPTLSGQVGNPASIERDRPALDCGGTELRTFLLGQGESICYRRGGDRGTISTGDRQGGGSPLVLSRVHWVRPELVAEVKFLAWTEDDLLRQVVNEGLREDKPAGDVRREVPGSKPI
jgi:hypothetical protein